MSDARPVNLLDPQAIAQGEALGLLARQVVEGFLSGEHKSPFRGFAVEFTQHREYAPGDDLRHVDWKVLARSDRFMLKQYEQETNFVCHLVVDASASMLYGSGGLTKLDFARRMAACLAYLVLHQRDAISLVVFDAATRRYIPRTGNLASIHSIMNALASFQPATVVGPAGSEGADPANGQADPAGGQADPAGGSSPLAPVLHELAVANPRKGIVILLSDFLDDEAATLKGIQHCRFAGHEVIALHTLDPAELTFPFTGNVAFEGLEGGGELLTRPSEIRKTYLAEMEAFQERLRLGCENNRCHYRLINTGNPLHETLAAYLAFRQKVRRR